MHADEKRARPWQPLAFGTIAASCRYSTVSMSMLLLWTARLGVHKSIRGEQAIAARYRMACECPTRFEVGARSAQPAARGISRPNSTRVRSAHTTRTQSSRRAIVRLVCFQHCRKCKDRTGFVPMPHVASSTKSEIQSWRRSRLSDTPGTESEFCLSSAVSDSAGGDAGKGTQVQRESRGNPDTNGLFQPESLVADRTRAMAQACSRPADALRVDRETRQRASGQLA